MTLRRTLVIASNNHHKIEEISVALGDGWRVLSAQDVAPGISWDETGTTFLENARIKIQALKAVTNHCVLADDSGLCVDALGGAPGVWSSSYGGREGDHGSNNLRLLSELKGVPTEKRRARFVCTLVFVDEHGREMICEGGCDGRILEEPDGNLGFGYDPLFFVVSHNCSMARLTSAEKNKISHRGRALAQLVSQL